MFKYLRTVKECKLRIQRTQAAANAAYGRREWTEYYLNQKRARRYGRMLNKLLRIPDATHEDSSGERER